MSINDNEENVQEVIRNVRSGKVHLGREGSYWSDSDVQKIKERFCEGIGISAIALELQRTESAVIQQIEKLNLFNRSSYNKHSEASHSSTGECRCCDCTCETVACPRFNSESHKDSNHHV